MNYEDKQLEYMNNQYDIRMYDNNEYAVYLKGNPCEYVFKGTLEAINAWVSLQAKGFDIN